MKYAIYLFLLTFTVAVTAQNKPHYSFPYNPDSDPLYIRANVIILKKSDGTGNFDLNIPEEKETLEGYLEKVNEVYANFKKPKDESGCYTGLDFYNDMGVRMVYNFIEIKNDYYWNLMNSGSQPNEKKYHGFSPSQSESWYLKPLNDSISQAPDIPKGINVYLTQNGDIYDDYIYGKNYDLTFTSTAAAEFPTKNDLNRSSQVHAPNRYLKYYLHKYKATQEYKQPWSVTQKWHFEDGKGLAHEFGHNFGLGHGNEYHKANKCSFSLMSQKHGHKKNWLPPTEIQKVHYNLTNTNLMQFVTPESFYNTTMSLYSDTEWKTKRRFYSNIDIKKNIKLTISDTIILPPQAKIELCKKAELILEKGAVILDAYGNEFKNIKKHRRAKIIRK